MRIILPDKHRVAVEGPDQTVGEVLLCLGIRPNEVLVTRDGKLLPEDAVIGGDVELKIIRISHGG